MTQHEEMILTKIDRTESFGVFISYNNSLVHIYDFYLNKDTTQKEKYQEHQKLEKSLISVQENMTKAEKYLQKLNEYVEFPEKFTDLSHYPKQISYKDIDPLTENFSSFIEDIYKGYDNFFNHLIDKLMHNIDSSKNYKAYLENKPNGHKKIDDIKKKKEFFIAFLKGINETAFSENFDELTKIYFDLNEKRNAIIHHGKTKSDLISGHYTVSVESETKEVKVRTLPTVKYYNKNYNILEYSNFIFMNILESMQHIFVACVNTLIERNPGNNGMTPYFYPVTFIKDLQNESFIRQTNVFSPLQLYIFGYFFNQNNFVAYQGSRPQNPDLLDKLKKSRKS